MKYTEQVGIEETKGAVFSDNMKYRYNLSRTWDKDLPVVTFIGLNPSVASASIDDPTIRRCRNFTKDWGYGGFIMVNLYAYRATDPKAMLKAENPIGIDNDQFIKNAVDCSKMIVFAWGSNAEVGRALNVIQFVPDGHCLGKNANGSPKHPLYIKGDTKPHEYAHYMLSTVDGVGTYTNHTVIKIGGQALTQDDMMKIVSMLNEGEIAL